MKPIDKNYLKTSITKALKSFKESILDTQFVKKVNGKGLVSRDFKQEYKNKLDEYKE